MILLRRPQRDFAVLSILGGLGGCTTVHVDDLKFERLRIVRAAEHEILSPSLRRFAANEAYPGGDLVEATLSTRRDLIEVMQRDDNWMLTSRARKCGAAPSSGEITDWPAVFHGRKGVASPDRFFGDDTAKPDDSKIEGGRYHYKVYFRARDKLRPNWEQEAYDLSASPFDVCIDVGAAAFAGVIRLESNVVTVPASAFEALYARR